MDVTKWKLLFALVMLSSVCGCEQSNQPEDRVDNIETDVNDTNELATSNEASRLPPVSETQSVVPSTGVTFEEVVPPFLLITILKVGMPADGPGHRYLGHDDTWHYVAAGQSDRVLVGPVGSISPEELNVLLDREEQLTELLGRGFADPPPLSAAVQAFCEAHSMTTAAFVDDATDANSEPLDLRDADSPYPERDGLFFITVAPDLAFYSLLQYPVDGHLLGNNYLGRDAEFHYIADEWDPFIWCCEIEHIDQDDLRAVVESQDERQDAFFADSLADPNIPFASHPQQPEQRAWRESHDFIQLEDQ